MVIRVASVQKKIIVCADTPPAIAVCSLHKLCIMHCELCIAVKILQRYLFFVDNASLYAKIVRKGVGMCPLA